MFQKIPKKVSLRAIDLAWVTRSFLTDHCGVAGRNDTLWSAEAGPCLAPRIREACQVTRLRRVSRGVASGCSQI